MSNGNTFGYDFLWTLRELLVRRKDNEFDDYADAIARCLLVQFGVSVEMVDEINRVFLQRLERSNLEDYRNVLQRLQSVVKDNDYVKEYMVSSFAAVTVSQRGELSQEQRDFMYGFQELFDMKPSQFQSAIQQGVNWATALEYVAIQYAKSGRLQTGK